MCGIVGAFRPAGLGEVPADAMLASLAHRGPDDGGLERFTGQEGRAYAILGARRLAIVDPAGGHQPLSDAAGRWWVAFNGEIYNHKALARELAARGVGLGGGADTAVLAALFADQGGEGALERLQGMFALAALDTARRRLVLARDRLGVKPLYWCHLPDGTLLWASEPRALLRHPAAPRRPDPIALRQYLLLEYVPAPRTAWEGIHKLLPGQRLIADESGARLERWWRPPVPRAERGGDLQRWSRSVAYALQAAVAARAEADVPVGYLLSGGVDSGAVAALGARVQPGPVRTFSLQVSGPGFDESAAAAETAAHVGADHATIRLEAGEIGPLLDEILAHLDEPLADSSLVPAWALLRGVRDAGLKCALSGDGADEIFGGYPTYRAHQLARLAAPFAGPIGRIAGRMPVRYEGVTADYMARRFAAGLPYPWARRHAVWMGAWLPEEIGMREADWAVIDEHGAYAAGADPVARAMVLDQRLYLAEGVLVKVDRASMAHGVEVRSPFLDYRLVELAAGIPTAFKVRGREDKAVLRRAAADWLPPAVVSRRKKGFGAPVGPWLRGEGRLLLADLPEAVEGWLDPDLVRQRIAEHLAGQADHRRRLWSALVLARWLRGPWGPR